MLHWFALLVLAALFAGCSATVPIRPYMFIQNEVEPSAPQETELLPPHERVS